MRVRGLTLGGPIGRGQVGGAAIGLNTEWVFFILPRNILRGILC